MPSIRLDHFCRAAADIGANGDNDMLPFGGTPVFFYNYGVLRKKGGGGATTIYMNYVDVHGTVEAQSGMIIFAGATNSFEYTEFTNQTGQIVVH